MKAFVKTDVTVPLKCFGFLSCTQFDSTLVLDQIIVKPQNRKLSDKLMTKQKPIDERLQNQIEGSDNKFEQY